MMQLVPGAFAAAHLERANQRKQHIEGLEDQITELAAHIYAATYRLLELVREYDEAEGWRQPGLRSCAHWLNWKCGIGMGAAREKVRVAHALKELPLTSDAFREGRISYSKVRAMTRVATAQNEDYLLMIADYGTASHVECVVRDYRKVKRSEALKLENERYAGRELSWYTDHDGCLVLRGRLTPEQGAVIRKALEAAQDEEFKERKHVPAETSKDKSRPNPDPLAARRADALERLAQVYFEGRQEASSSGDRYLVHVHSDLDTLNKDGAGAQSEMEDGGCVSAETSRRMCCDSGIVRWLENNKGETLSVGRKSRVVPPAIRRALQRRDGGCRFPGCTATRFVDAHHIRHWSDGGETSLENLVLLCRHHHRLVHEGGFGILVEACGGRISFKNPQGRIVPDNGETRSRGNVFALITSHEESGLEITPETTITQWRGERMDRQQAVLGMLQRE
jgi:hypothetical protein